MTGGLLQLAAYGTQDIYLTGNPQITFFVAIYKRYTNFAIESIRQLFTGDATFGKKVYCNVGRHGDLISDAFMNIKLPSLVPYKKKFAKTQNEVEYAWVNSIGNALIKHIDINIGGSLIDRHYGIWLEIWSELTVPSGKKHAYYEMIGKSENKFNLVNKDAQNLFIPLQFWFCKNKGLALPLIALQTHEVRIYVSFREITELIISSVQSKDKDDPLNKYFELFTKELKIDHASIFFDYIFLEDEERRRFAKNKHEYLIEQLQVSAHSLYSNGLMETSDGLKIRKSDVNHRVSLDFNHPVKELIWVIQNSNVLTKRPYGGNEWFNFSDKEYNIDSNYNDPLVNAKIMLEGKDRCELRSAEYYRIVQPYQRHTNVPNNFIYVYSFCFNPEEHQPSGTCNFSRIDNKHLVVELSKELIDPIITVFAVNYNILQIEGGMAGIAYSN